MNRLGLVTVTKSENSGNKYYEEFIFIENSNNKCLCCLYIESYSVENVRNVLWTNECI